MQPVVGLGCECKIVYVGDWGFEMFIGSQCSIYPSSLHCKHPLLRLIKGRVRLAAYKVAYVLRARAEFEGMKHFTVLGLQLRSCGSWGFSMPLLQVINLKDCVKVVFKTCSVILVTIILYF